MNTQRGSGSLLAVIILLMMSATLLHATRTQLDNALGLLADERQFYLQYSRADTALAWGGEQHWLINAGGWVCKADPLYGRACLSMQGENSMLLRGDAGSGTLAHYRWVVPIGSMGRIGPVLHGWIDYCPLSVSEACQPE
ncbi:DUF2509 family protein [Erwinia tasmaniensis]|uniref:DUF2509 family protein n=1 Tax=Erwinia tasmaniensis TaxID=338565 RepID=UPI003A4DED9C